ncbi:hypothetical protein GCM10011247_40760 [Pseudomonas plecoglossicida]|nr:hypothetical protein GCM10011247_40760 [Pseudomonas plecoglossicida]
MGASLLARGPCATPQHPRDLKKQLQDPEIACMTPEHIESISNHPDFQHLVRRKRRLNGSLTLAMLVIYYGFVLLVAFSPSTLGQSLSGGVTTVGMLVGVLMVLLSFALTGIYVHRANNVLDPLNDKVKQECAQ